MTGDGEKRCEAESGIDGQIYTERYAELVILDGVLLKDATGCASSLRTMSSQCGFWRVTGNGNVAEALQLVFRAVSCHYMDASFLLSYGAAYSTV